MKKIYLLAFAAMLGLVVAGCKKDLPFPYDQVTRGVVIDILRTPGSDGVLSDGVTSGNYKIQLTIPTQQGDYSMMDHAQLLAVLTSGGATTAQVAVDNITTFPTELTLDMADVYSKFGKTAPAIGDVLNFAVNVVLKDGTTIPGWDPVTNAYNNMAFTPWIVKDRPFNYKVQYNAICAFDPTSTFIGTFTCDESYSSSGDSYSVTLSHHPDNPATADIPVGVDPGKLYGIKIETTISPNILEATEPLYVWINQEDFSLIIPNQFTGWNYSPTAPVYWWGAKNMSISSCDRTINFTVAAWVPALNGGFGDFSFSIHL